MFIFVSLICLCLTKLCVGWYQAWFIFVPSNFTFLKCKSYPVSLQPFGGAWDEVLPLAPSCLSSHVICGLSPCSGRTRHPEFLQGHPRYNLSLRQIDWRACVSHWKLFLGCRGSMSCIFAFVSACGAVGFHHHWILCWHPGKFSTDGYSGNTGWIDNVERW